MKAALFEHDDSRLEYKATQNTGRGSQGGFAIPKKFLPMLKEVSASEAVVRSRAMVIPADGGMPDAEIEIPALDQDASADGSNNVYGGVQVVRSSEGKRLVKTGFKLRNINLKPEEFSGYIPLTERLLNNWNAAAAFASKLLKGAITSAEEHAFITALGQGGILGVQNSSAAIKVARESANSISYLDVKRLVGKHKGDVNKSVIIAPTGAKENFLSMVGDGGGATNIVDSKVKVNADGSVSMYGMPVKFYDRSPSLGNEGDLGIYDFSKYLIKDGSGPIISIGQNGDDFLENKKSVKIVWNVDGQPWVSAPYTDEADFQTSPFVLLDDVTA